MIHSNFGHYFEDFTSNEIIEHSLSKTIFESDNNLFSLLTMNHHPVHTNIQYALNNKHERILVVGTLVFSLAVGITVPEISGKAIANLEYSEIKHLNPVYINDTIYCKTRVLSTRKSQSNPHQGIVSVETIVYNQEQAPVLSFKRNVLLKCRAYDN